MTSEACALTGVPKQFCTCVQCQKPSEPIFTITGTIIDMGDLEHGRGMVIGKSSKPLTLLGLSQDELIAMRMSFAEEVTLTVTPSRPGKQAR